MQRRTLRSSENKINCFQKSVVKGTRISRVCQHGDHVSVEFAIRNLRSHLKLNKAHVRNIVRDYYSQLSGRLRRLIGGFHVTFHVTSSSPCCWTKTKHLSLAPFVRPPAIVHYTIVIVSRDWLRTVYTSYGQKSSYFKEVIMYNVPAF